MTIDKKTESGNNFNENNSRYEDYNREEYYDDDCYDCRNDYYDVDDYSYDDSMYDACDGMEDAYWNID